MNPSPEILTRRWFEEIWGQRRIETADELLSPRLVGWSNGRKISNSRDFRLLYDEFITAFPDLEMKIDDLVADGDRVAVRWSASGTHTGEARGMKPTGRRVTFVGSTWLHFENGLIVRGWDTWDLGGLMGELAS